MDLVHQLIQIPPHYKTAQFLPVFQNTADVMNPVACKQKRNFQRKINQQSENSIWPKISNIIFTHVQASVIADTLRFQIHRSDLIARYPAFFQMSILHPEVLQMP